MQPCPSVTPTNAAVSSAFVFGRTGITSPKFVQPGCTATTNPFQIGEMLLHEGVEAYKKEGPKFMQRLVAKQKARIKDSRPSRD